MLAGKQITELVTALNSLHDGESAVDALVAHGSQAIPHVARFLLEGRISSVAEPRVRAVRVLERLGAVDVLIRYLRAPRPVSDPVLRFAEEAVESHAARALARWKSDESFQAVLQLFKSRSLLGAAEALGKFGRVEAVPYLIRALGDDFCAPVAEEALEEFGPAARDWLRSTVMAPEPNDVDEIPSSVCRRRRSMRLLLRIGVQTADWDWLAAIVTSPDAELATTAAMASYPSAPAENREAILRALVSSFDSLPWNLQIEIEEFLVDHREEARNVLRDEIRRREMQSAEATAHDKTLALVRSVLARKAERRADGT